ncbi:MAG: phosphate/phosphite/phosphonate ABC transporter substrate-binding protein [Pseudomonadota bacterium]
MCCIPGPAFAAGEQLVFGVVPQQSATRLAEFWGPLMKHLSKVTGYQIKFATAKDIPTFEACLARNAYDIAYMNPYHYTVFHDVAGYRAFAKQLEKRLKGVIVARADSKIANLSDLDGSDVAFPSPAAFGASVIPRAEMRNQSISFTPKYVKSHDSVYRSVALGLFPAGGGVGRTFNNISDTVRAQLKVVYTTSNYTPHAFAASPSVASDIVASIAAEMVAVRDQSLLKPLGMKGFEHAESQDWDDVRDLNLERKQTEIASSGEVQCR